MSTTPKPNPPVPPLEFVAPPTTDADETSTPPEGLDAATAWAEISALRGEVRDLKTRATAARSARDKAIEEGDEAATRSSASALEDLLSAQRAELAAAHRELYVARALRKSNLEDDVVEFLTGDDEEAILASAKRLSSLLARRK